MEDVESISEAYTGPCLHWLESWLKRKQLKTQEMRRPFEEEQIFALRKSLSCALWDLDTNPNYTENWPIQPRMQLQEDINRAMEPGKMSQADCSHIQLMCFETPFRRRVV
ncbi:uncharacterized protein RBU33_001961 isoform 1-T2 [Hipposideros larvatus]